MTRLPSPRGRVGFKETLTLGLAIAAVVVCLGGGALVLATQIEDVAAQTVIREIGAVLLAIGFLELLHQLFLNRSLANEIFGAVRLASTITETGLEDIGRAPVGWEEFLTEGKVFYLLARPSAVAEKRMASSS